MAFNFPASPTVGQIFSSAGKIYIWDGTTWKAAGSNTAIISDAPPSNPVSGALWWESDTGRLFIWFDDGNSSQWVQIPASVPPVAAVVPQGQCYLEKVGANLVLSRFNGTQLFIDGGNRLIPSTGVSLAATGLTVAGGREGFGDYLIYAAMSGGVMVLEASIVLPVDDATSGMRLKTGDPSRTFVGMASLGSDGNWHTYVTTCASWFNPKKKTQYVSNSASTASTSYAELVSAIRIPFVNLRGREIECVSMTSGTHNLATGQDGGLEVLLVRAGFVVGQASRARYSATSGTLCIPYCVGGSVLVQERYDYTAPYGYTTSGTVAYAPISNQLSIWG